MGGVPCKSICPRNKQREMTAVYVVENGTDKGNDQ